MEQEIWKVYKDTRYNPAGHLYEVSNLGRAKCDGIIEEPSIHFGYYWFHNRFLHRMIAETHIPNPDNKPCVDHIDGNKFNNRVDNLRWVTHSENNNNPITRKHNSESQNKEETRNKRSKSLKEANKNPETIEKHRKGQSGKIAIHLGNKRTYVDPEYLDYWLDDGWVYSWRNSFY
jgi:hypothetical protein